VTWQVIGRAPARDDCDAPLILTSGAQVRVQRCRASSSNRCEPCAETYRRRVRRIAVDGCSLYTGSTIVMVTLTAPGNEQHTMPSGEVCPCTPDGGVHLAEWNGTCSGRFSRFVEDVRRMTGVKLQYFRAAEVQKRGALHFHILFRVPVGMRVRLSLGAVRRLALKHGFGHSVDVTGVEPERAAGYVAKYASKAAAARASMPWMHRRTGELSNGYGRYRVWTSSRDWGVTMASVRAAQAAWWLQMAGVSPAEGRQAGPATAGPLDNNGQSSAEGLVTASEGGSIG
jgi:hypothetical protein